MPEEEISFKEKLKSLQFMRGESNRRNYYDSEAINRDFDVELAKHETEGVGWLKRDAKGKFWKPDPENKAYQPATRKDLEKLTDGELKEIPNQFGV